MWIAPLSLPLALSLCMTSLLLLSICISFFFLTYSWARVSWVVCYLFHHFICLFCCIWPWCFCLKHNKCTHFIYALLSLYHWLSFKIQFSVTWTLILIMIFTLVPMTLDLTIPLEGIKEWGNTVRGTWGALLQSSLA